MPVLFRLFAALTLLALATAASSQTSAQAPATPQPLNGSVSDYGTTFIFSPPPICPHCVETELGVESVSGGSRLVPAVVSVAPFRWNTDFSVLANLLDSESSGGDRTTQFGNRLDFVIRQQIVQKRGFFLSLAPRGALFTRGAGGRAGATAAPQFSKGNNLIAANFTWTGAIGTSPANPRSDYQGYADYFRTLDARGTALFLGFAHELTAGQQTVGTEEGLVIPFRNGQLELEAAQLDMNTDPEWQFQARVIANWGRILLHR